MSSDTPRPLRSDESIVAYGTPLAATREGTLSYLPVALFGSVMGITGLASAWNLAHSVYGTPLWIGQVIGGFAIFVFVLMGTGYAIKAATGFRAVKAEFQHPIAGNLFGTLFISLLLIPIPIAEYSPRLARWIWVAGTLGMIVFAWVIISRWLGSRQQPGHATPAWIVPMVGLVDIPLAVPALQLQGQGQGQEELLTFSLGLGLFFAVPLFTLVMSRLLFEEPLPVSLQPSLMILVAPFALGFSAYVNITDTVDHFASALYALTIFMLSVVIGRIRYLAVCCPFRLSWWAVSFPSAGAAVCALRYAQHTSNVFTDSVAIVLLIGVTLLLFVMTLKTLASLARGNLKHLAG